MGGSGSGSERGMLRQGLSCLWLLQGFTAADYYITSESKFQRFAAPKFMLISMGSCH